MLENCRVIDLTHEIREDIPTWLGDCGFRFQLDADYPQDGFRTMSFHMVGGIGTHMDSPSHFIPDTAAIADIQVENFVAPLCILRVSVGNNADYLVSEKDLEYYEKEHGLIPKKSLVVADTGWAQYWNDPIRYRNVDSEGQMHFPGFSIATVKQLVDREIVGIGIDTLSPDSGSLKCPVHHFLLPKGKYIIENIAHLDKVPVKGAWAIALPPKIRNAPEAPCRIVAITPNH